MEEKKAMFLGFFLFVKKELAFFFAPSEYPLNPYTVLTPYQACEFDVLVLALQTKTKTRRASR